MAHSAQQIVPVAVLISVIAGLMVWLPEAEQSLRKSTEYEQNQGANYYLENFRLIQTDAQGQAYQWLEGQRLAHYPGNMLELLQPQFSFQGDNAQQIWQISAEHGWMMVPNIMELSSQVQIKQVGTDSKNISVQAQDLQFDLQAQTGRTENKVQITQDRGQIEAVGMHLNLQQQTLELTSQVKGHYVP